MELIPVIADFFGVTAERLLEVHESIEPKKIEQYMQPFHELSFPSKAPNHRKTLTCLAKVVEEKADVVKRSRKILEDMLGADGIPRTTFDTPYQKKCFKHNLQIAHPYAEIGLEPNHKIDRAILCELTFGAVALYIQNCCSFAALHWTTILQLLSVNGHVVTFAAKDVVGISPIKNIPNNRIANKDWAFSVSCRFIPFICLYFSLIFPKLSIIVSGYIML